MPERNPEMDTCSHGESPAECQVCNAASQVEDEDSKE